MNTGDVVWFTEPMSGERLRVTILEIEGHGAWVAPLFPGDCLWEKVLTLTDHLEPM